MEISRSKQNKAGLVLGAALLLALAVAIFAADAQPAQAQVGIEAGNNFIGNGSFETGGGHGIPLDWTPDALGMQDKRICSQSKAGSCSFLMYGNGSWKSLEQCFNHAGNAGDEFKIKGWAKTKSLVLGGGEATIRVEFRNPNQDFVPVSIPGGTSGWTLRQGTAIAPADYDLICVALILDAPSGKIWFDKLSLVFVPVP